MSESPLGQQVASEKEGAASTFPRRRSTRVREDEGAQCVVALLKQLAARVPHEPAIKPPEGGMVRLGGMDRASYVWFLQCREDTRPDSGGVVPHFCNHGIGVDRRYGTYAVRAWVHGSPGVHSLELHTNEVTAAMLETAANLVGIPLNPRYDHEHPRPSTCIEGVECCICHRRERGTAPAVESDGYQGAEMRVTNHGFADMEDCPGRVMVEEGSIRIAPTHPRGSVITCLACLEYRVNRGGALPNDLRCPTCDSRQPSQHPAVSGGGEVTSLCPDPFHGDPYPQEYSVTDPDGA